MVPRLSILCFIRLTRVSSQMCFLVTTSTFSLREWIKQARSCSSWVTTKVPGSSRRKCSIKKTLISEVIFGWTKRNFRKWTISTKIRCMCRMCLQFLRRHFVSLTIVMLFNQSGGHQDVMIFNFTRSDLQHGKLLLCLRWIRKDLGNSIQRLFCRNAARCLVMKAEKQGFSLFDCLFCMFYAFIKILCWRDICYLISEILFGREKNYLFKRNISLWKHC